MPSVDEQRRIALFGLFSAFHNCFIKSAFYRNLVKKASSDTCEHHGHKIQIAQWRTVIHDYCPNKPPRIFWYITLTNAELGTAEVGAWEVSSYDNKVSGINVRGHTGWRDTLYLHHLTDQGFEQLFNALHKACGEYIETHRIPIRNWSLEAQFFHG